MPNISSLIKYLQKTKPKLYTQYSLLVIFVYVFLIEDVVFQELFPFI